MLGKVILLYDEIVVKNDTFQNFSYSYITDYDIEFNEKVKKWNKFQSEKQRNHNPHFSNN